jgi:thiamine-phosphate pyrophosphorylase
MSLPRLLVLTDRAQLPLGRSLTQTVSACARAGATHFVVRELDLSHDQRTALVTSLARIPDIVLIAARTRLQGASGVHLASAQDDDDAAGIRGRSCHDEAEVRRAVGDGASYVTVSPVAPSDSKPGYGPPLGPSGVRRLVAAANGTPVFALGGVTPGNARSFRDAGVWGIAVMGSFMRTDDPAAMTERLLTEVNG